MRDMREDKRADGECGMRGRPEGMQGEEVPTTAPDATGPTPIVVCRIATADATRQTGVAAAEKETPGQEDGSKTPDHQRRCQQCQQKKQEFKCSAKGCAFMLCADDCCRANHAEVHAVESS